MIDATRREFLQSSGLAAVGAAMASTAGGASAATAQSESSSFDIDKAFAAFMRDLGGNAEDAGGRVLFTGRDPILQSPFRLGACMAIPAMAGGVGAAAVWRERTGQAQELSIDLRQALYGIAPWARFLADFNIAAGILPPGWLPPEWTWDPTLNGRNIQAPFLLGNPLGFQVFETKDGRLVTPTGIYPHHFIGFLSLIGAGPEQRQIADRIRAFDSAELEEMVGEAGMIMGIHRTVAEWAAHPQGQAIANIPVIEIIKIGDSDPIPWANSPTAPLSGIRVLSNSHVIASSTASRTLAGYGAEALHVARDQGFEHDGIVVDVNVGMRSTLLDLKNPEQNRVQQRLVPGADVFVEGFRGRKMEELGFGAEELARVKPGIVYLSVRPYGWEGPWKMFAGFDMEALTVTGCTLIEGGGQRPRFPRTFVLNDYIAGYMGAAGVIAALRRRAQEGGSYHVRVHLARCATWFQSLGFNADGDFERRGPDNQLVAPEVIRGQTPYGEVERLAPLVKLSRTPVRWRTPLVAVRGGDLPVWES
jgi:crotonobetainyl-CoA:carnitine CoA-transferase CaiB-like acyl-CoA transferase